MSRELSWTQGRMWILLLLLGFCPPVVADPGTRPATLEDFFGPTGNLFQGALSFINFESDVATGPISSYGWGVDDMVVQWREFRLDQDQSDCEVGGSCATIDLMTVNVFEADGSLEVTVHDATPYGRRCTSTGRCTVSGASCTTDAGCTPDGGLCKHLPCSGALDCTEAGESCASSFNDCDGNGHYFDGGDDDDCDDDGVQDVIAVATSQDLFCKDLGDFLKQRCSGSTAYLYFGNRELIKQIGLRVSWKRPLASGGVDGRLVKLEMY